MNPIRIITAASLFDGHDAAINIMRRVLQAHGAEVIHLGHDRSVEDVVRCAIQEDADAIAMTSYQGGHVEYFKYMVELLQKFNSPHIRVFGGGGGVILPNEIAELHQAGVERIYSPDDGRAMGLDGMIQDLLSRSQKARDVRKAKESASGGVIIDQIQNQIQKKDPHTLGKLISWAENEPEKYEAFKTWIHSEASRNKKPILGITGTGGAGKSSLVDEFLLRYLRDFSEKTIAVLSVDPSKRKTGGALLGDRIRMNAASSSRVFMRSMATRKANASLSQASSEVLKIYQAAGFDLVILESSGIGQSGSEIVEHSDVSMYVMTPEYGASTQLEKIDMIDFADIIALNKFDKKGAPDALKDIQKQYKRSRKIFDAKDDTLPVIGTIASQFNDPGMNRLYLKVLDTVQAKTGQSFQSQLEAGNEESRKVSIVPPSRVRYLSEISETVRKYNEETISLSDNAEKAYALQKSAEVLKLSDSEVSRKLQQASDHEFKKIPEEARTCLQEFDDLKSQYESDQFQYQVRGKTITVPTKTKSLSGLKIPKVMMPEFQSWGERLRWIRQGNVPGSFPFTAGVFPFKREEEDPTRMFAGEGGPERTNRRFHYVSQGMPAKRLSTAFDSVTLYGNDPAIRPDIYGKIGNSGVSICCLDDAKRLYSGFDLCDPKTSVSMTINGPAPLLVSFFMNAAIDQQAEKYIKAQGLESEVRSKIDAYFKSKNMNQPQYRGSLPPGNDGLGLMLLGMTADQVLSREVYEKIKADTLRSVRGTVQADILKEDQAQNTCIFSTEFSLKLMGDVQEYFIENQMRNFYSVSISGYHIAEAGANPISQLAFTLANGFTYVEYYRARGMNINDFAPNLSFFFSNGLDPEYAVIGRVARRIWAKAMKLKYGADVRSQMLKYHIQTSGRSLHAQEIDFNDIRTTLQALLAIYDNCNSLHTNAYDEAITTPTEESVRRAIAIQMIINKELGSAKSQNLNQGSFFIEKLTDWVEEAVLQEFDRITDRGGVLGAMETMYQRNKIQEESLYYERLKHEGSLPIVGVNTYLSSKGSPTVLPQEVIRSTEDEKRAQILTVEQVSRAAGEAGTLKATRALQTAAIQGQNVFTQMMESAKVCTLGQMTEALFQVGGRYRRNM